VPAQSNSHPHSLFWSSHLKLSPSWPSKYMLSSFSQGLTDGWHDMTWNDLCKNRNVSNNFKTLSFVVITGLQTTLNTLIPSVKGYGEKQDDCHWQKMNTNIHVWHMIGCSFGPDTRLLELVADDYTVLQFSWTLFQGNKKYLSVHWGSLGIGRI